MLKEIIEVLPPENMSRDEKKIFYLSHPRGSYGNSQINFGPLRSFRYVCLAPKYEGEFRKFSNTELIILPLRGTLSIWYAGQRENTLGFGEMQIISAGRYAAYREKNPSFESVTEFLEIQFTPLEEDTTPENRYYDYRTRTGKGEFNLVLSDKDKRISLLHQSISLHMGFLEDGQTIQHKLRNKLSGAFVFLLGGEMAINGGIIQSRTGVYIHRKDIELKAIQQSVVMVIGVELQPWVRRIH